MIMMINWTNLKRVDHVLYSYQHLKISLFIPPPPFIWEKANIWNQGLLVFIDYYMTWKTTTMHCVNIISWYGMLGSRIHTTTRRETIRVFFASRAYQISQTVIIICVCRYDRRWRQCLTINDHYTVTLFSQNQSEGKFLDCLVR